MAEDMQQTEPELSAKDIVKALIPRQGLGSTIAVSIMAELERKGLITPEKTTTSSRKKEETAWYKQNSRGFTQGLNYETVLGEEYDHRLKSFNEPFYQNLGWYRESREQKELLLSRFIPYVEKHYPEAPKLKDQPEMATALERFKERSYIRELEFYAVEGAWNRKQDFLKNAAENLRPSDLFASPEEYVALMMDAYIGPKQTRIASFASPLGNEKARIILQKEPNFVTTYTREPYKGEKAHVERKSDYTSATVQVDKPYTRVVVGTDMNHALISLCDDFDPITKTNLREVDYLKSIKEKALVYHPIITLDKPEISLGNQRPSFAPLIIMEGVETAQLDLSHCSPLSSEGAVRICPLNSFPIILSPQTKHCTIDLTKGALQRNIETPLEIILPTAFFTQQQGQLQVKSKMGGYKDEVLINDAEITLANNQGTKLELKDEAHLYTANPFGGRANLNIRLVAPNGQSQVIPVLRKSIFIGKDGKELQIDYDQLVKGLPLEEQERNLRISALGFANGYTTYLKDLSADLEARIKTKETGITR